MPNLDELGLRRAQTMALEQLLAIQCISGDLRWALAELALRSIAAMLATGRKRLACWGRRLAQRVHLANQLTPADTMVAAGGR